MPFRRLNQKQQYKKYDWIDARLVRNTSDPRPETYRPFDSTDFENPVGHVGTGDHWRERRKLLLETARVYDRLDDLITAAKANEISLAVFKPTRITDFVWEEEERAWDPERIRQMRDATKQYDLFEDNAWRETFKLIDKLPYSFSYKFEDSAGKKSELQVLDWETGALYWNCLRSSNGDEPKAIVAGLSCAA